MRTVTSRPLRPAGAPVDELVALVRVTKGLALTEAGLVALVAGTGWVLALTGTIRFVPEVVLLVVVGAVYLWVLLLVPPAAAYFLAAAAGRLGLPRPYAPSGPGRGSRGTAFVLGYVALFLVVVPALPVLWILALPVIDAVG